MEKTKLVSKVMLEAYSQLNGVKVITMCCLSCKLQADENETDSSDSLGLKLLKVIIRNCCSED